MTAAATPFRDKPFALASEETRWFAHCLFGRCEDRAPRAPGWRGNERSPKPAE